MRAKTITIDPRMFISPPYIACPKCNKDSYGVLMINDHNYVRRCKECWHSDSYPLPSLNKKLIYLDQFAISEMMKAINKPLNKSTKVNPFFLTIFEKLDTLSKLQLVICPDSHFHEEESLLSRYYDALKEMYEHLSGGLSYYDPRTVRRFQVCNTFRHQIGIATKDEVIKKSDLYHGNKDVWQDRIRVSVRSKTTEKEIKALRQSREQIQQHLISTFQRWQTEKHKKFKHWYDEERSSFGSGIVKRYVHSLADFMVKQQEGKLPDVNLVLGEDNIIITSLTHYLPHNMPDKEKYAKIFQFLNSPSVNEIPYVKISAALFASMAHQAAHGGRKQPPNIGTASDISMIATLLPYCDAIFVDREMYELMHHPEVQKILSQFPTKIFSMVNKDEFLKYLDGIQKSADPDLMKKISEVYGEDWSQPYYTMYENNSRTKT